MLPGLGTRRWRGRHVSLRDFRLSDTTRGLDINAEFWPDVPGTPLTLRCVGGGPHAGAVASLRMRMRILALWPIHRPGLLRPFVELAATGAAETLILLPGHDPNHARHPFPEGVSVVHLGSVRSITRVFEEFNPSVVTVLDHGWLPSIVTLVARGRGIPVAWLQHGVQQFSHQYRDLRRRAVRDASAVAESAKVPRGSSSISNAVLAATKYICAEPFMAARFLPILLVAESVRRLVPYSKLAYWVSRRVTPPDHFFVISTALAPHAIEVYRPGPERVHSVGLAEMDAVIGAIARLESSSPTSHRDTLLMIDTPNVRNWRGRSTLTLAQKTRLADSLAAVAQSLGLVLAIRLHPENLDTTWIPPGATVLPPAGGLGDQISRARVVVGFNSTALIPAIGYRPTVLLGAGDTPLEMLGLERDAVVVIGVRSAEDADVLSAAVTRALCTTADRDGFLVAALGDSGPSSVSRLEAALRSVVARTHTTAED